MKILMTLMGLEIGGAETHVVELACELKRMGHTVVVSSSGGVYEKELNDNLIKHVKLPLATKDPISLMRSYFGLKRLIKQEKFDIVHAHARIPGVICGMLAKKLKFKYITTAHYDFKLNPFYKKVTNWGEYQLAVSHDLKNYLIENYAENPDNISVTINGIDTDKFTSDFDSSEIFDEFSINKTARRVLYVGRIDKEVAHAALRLAENAYKIAQHHPGTQVIIVGGGSAFDELEEYANRSNIIAGYKCVTLTGPRTDISAFTAMCDVFVGVSRAALEAMAAKRPVVLAGAQGYMGIFEKSKLEVARANNFTCRGEIIPDGDMIVNDVCNLLSCDGAVLKSLGEYNHEVVKKYYSVSKMAGDYLKVYENSGSSRYEKADVIISGYYGFSNLGDDTLLRSLIGALRREKPDIKITVLCAKPKAMSSLYGARCINRYNIPAIISEMRKAKILINGGGNLIQDGTSKKSLLYYTSIMKLAKKCGLKTVLYANGIGPLYNSISRKRAKNAIDNCDHITLRDPDSIALLQEIGCEDAAKKAKISADPAFCRLESDPKWIKFILEREGLDKDAGYFMVSVRSGNTLSKEDFDQRVLTEMTKAITSISEKYALCPIFVPFQSKIDDEMTKALFNATGKGIILSDLRASELCGIIDICKFTLSMRLHLLIFSASEGIPMIGLSYDKKVDSFLNYIDSPNLLDIRSFRCNDIINMADDIMKNSENIKLALSEKSEKFRALAENDAKEVIKLL